jgi:hypothetical protein
MSTTTTRISAIPLTIGIALWAAATGLLLEEAIHAGRYDVATMATPILTAATVAAAVLAHVRLSQWRVVGAVGFAGLALLGSLVMVSGTLGRVAEAKDAKQAGNTAGNRQFGLKNEELATAKREAAVECRSGFGQRCGAAKARIDAITADLASMKVVAIDAKADAIARLASLLGANGEWVRNVVQSTDPVAMPLFIELASIAFFAAAFSGRRKRAIVPQSSTQSSTQSTVETIASPRNQAEWAKMWNVHPSTAGRRLRAMEAAGQLRRQRDGRNIIALPAPERN